MTQDQIAVTNLETVRRHLIDCWQDGGFELFDELFNADFVDHNAMPGLSDDVAGMRRTAEMIRTAFPVHTYEIVRMVAIGDLVVNHWVLRGTNTGPFLDAPASGRAVEFAGIDIMRLSGGRISESWHVEELARLQHQLGRTAEIGFAVPSPGGC